MDLESENYCIDILFGEREYEVIMAKLLDLPTVQSFDCNGEQSSLSQRWTKWKKSFEYYMTASDADFCVKKDLTLEKVQDIARASEAADQHSAQFEEVHINRVQVKRDFNAARHQRHDYHSKRKDIECHRCGRTGHIARECTVAMDKTCHKCGKMGHFAKKCKSKKSSKEQGKFYKKEKVRYMEEESSDDSEEYVFAIDRSSEKRITLKIGDVVIPFLVDSGACNIINSEIMSKLKKCGVNKIPIEKQLYAYGAINPLMIKKSKIRSDIT
ncbi:unnamed protein product [Mytilus coruscus]|uniref:CCHC-type domain-containing protein n=1 Tax=Mytilus coruscus TaxID=42192 RepID=A0A6J8CLT3_MYTCO|nr:unnamed protein product [Mytilus coruscus]